MDFVYDSDGKRVRKTSGGNTTTYYYNGNVLSGLVRKASKDAGTTGTGTTVQFVYDTPGKAIHAASEWKNRLLLSV